MEIFVNSNIAAIVALVGLYTNEFNDYYHVNHINRTVAIGSLSLDIDLAVVITDGSDLEDVGEITLWSYERFAGFFDVLHN